MPPLHRLIIVFLLAAIVMHGQNKEIDRLMDSELKMTFPSIYFKHNSGEYAPMPYSVDSCFAYIAMHSKDVTSLVIWRDSLESEKLTALRIKKLKKGLAKHKEARGLSIESMGKAQKISRPTIAMAGDSIQMQYLLSLNSVFEISKTRMAPNKISMSDTHLYHPKIWCWSCIKSGFHMDRKSRNLRKAARRNKEAKTKQ